MINTAFKLYDKFLNVYTTQYNNLHEDSKKKVNVLNESEMLNLDLPLISTNLPLMAT